MKYMRYLQYAYDENIDKVHHQKQETLFNINDIKNYKCPGSDDEVSTEFVQIRKIRIR